jgi:hypothetical protein
MKESALGQILHRSATTTEAVRRAIQNSQESLRALSKRYGINQKTVAKWKNRGFVADLPTGPKQPKSTVLSIEDEALVVAFRWHTLLPLDDCLYVLQSTIPHLTRSSLHRCLQRHGISRLPEVKGDKQDKSNAKTPPIGCFRINVVEVSIAEGALRLYIAIDRTSRFAFAQIAGAADKTPASAFLGALIRAVPYKIHAVVADADSQFARPPQGEDPTTTGMTPMFETRSRDKRDDGRFAAIKPPWTNGQAALVTRTIEEAFDKRHRDEGRQRFQSRLADFINAYNYGRRLKALEGLTPYEYICRIWTKDPKRFRLDPIHQMPGLEALPEHVVRRTTSRARDFV